MKPQKNLHNLILIIAAGIISLGQLGSVNFMSGVNVYAHELAILILVVLACFKSKNKIKFSNTIIASSAMFVGAAFVSLVLALIRFSPIQVAIGSLYLWRWILYASMYFIVAYGKISSKYWISLLYLSALFLAVAGYFQLLWYPSLQNLVYAGWDPHHYRMFSTFLDPNFLGIYLLFGFILGIWYIDKNKYIWITQIALAVGLFSTYSRSTYVAVSVVLLVALIRWKGILPAVIGLFAFIILVFSFPKISGDTLRLDRFDSSASRVHNWQWALEQFSGSPIVGHGFSTLRYLPRIDEVRADTLQSRSSAGVDNSFLFLLVSTGCVGFGVYGYLLYTQVLMGRAVIKIKKYSIIGVLFILSLYAAVVHSLFINSLFYPWVMLWMWTLTGVMQRIISDTSHSE